MISVILNDVRYALRGILARPAFSTIVVAILTLGIGANTAIFSVVNGILLRPLPYPESQRLIALEHLDPYYKVSEPEFAEYRHARSLERIAAFTIESANATDAAGEPEHIMGSRVSDGFFQILGVAPVLGRTFTPDEDTPNGPRV